MPAYIPAYINETIKIAQQIDHDPIAAGLLLLDQLRSRKGRLFILGNGGSAANASHAVNDFRKIAHIEAYAPTDNVAELTAWINDVSFEKATVNYLQTSNITSKDMLLVLSVGGGTATASANLTLAMQFAHVRSIPILSIVSCDGGKAKELSGVCILIPVVHAARITPHAEEFQSVLLHLLVNALAEEQI